MAHAISPLESRDLVARACPEGLAKTSETALQLFKNRPNFQVQVWAGYTFCCLAGGLTQCSAKWPSGSKDFQQPPRIKPK